MKSPLRQHGVDLFGGHPRKLFATLTGREAGRPEEGRPASGRRFGFGALARPVFPPIAAILGLAASPVPASNVASVKQVGMVPGLLAGANLGQPFAEDGRKSGFDLGCDEAGFVQILEMRFVLSAKAGEFHPD